VPSPEARTQTLADLAPRERRLWEIYENLARADLTELERGEHLAELKAIYERDHPEAKASAGAALAQKRWDATDNLAIASFAKTAATDTGIDERSVRRAIRRATEIAPRVRDRIRENPEIADSGVELDALAAMPEPSRPTSFQPEKRFIPRSARIGASVLCGRVSRSRNSVGARRGREEEKPVARQDRLFIAKRWDAAEEFSVASPLPIEPSRNRSRHAPPARVPSPFLNPDLRTFSTCGGMLHRGLAPSL
jgi:hypothetical protein